MNMVVLTSLLLLTTVWSADGLPVDDRPACDYSSCPKTEPNKVNIHIVAHSHDDVGWLKTVDQYYYGLYRKDIPRKNMQGVQYIYDSVVDALNRSNDKRFIFVETAFFWMWWQEQDQETQTMVRNMVDRGQIELISGGWSMNDEACTHYNSIIDQMTWGFRRLKDTFGDCGVPKIGWQIDPFGHSREQASLFAQMNFDGVIFPRVEMQEMWSRERNKTLEMMWLGSDDLGRSSSIFTSVMAKPTWDRLYNAPPGFCFDLMLCRDEPIIDNQESAEYNLDRRLAAFVNWTQAYINKYATNHILMTFGGDFTYQYANGWFKNIDKLAKHVNNRSDLNWHMFYSTPSCYVKAIADSKLKLVTKTDDFFPYASKPHAFWTGFFTSRPTSKYYERFGNNVLQVCKQLDALARLNNTDKRVTLLREAMGILQHHDAITGTERQDVTEDYHWILSRGIDACESVISQALNILMTKKGLVVDETDKQQHVFCQLLNVSECAVTENASRLAVTVFNPIGQRVDHFVRLPVVSDAVVYSYDGQRVASELISTPDYIRKLPGRKSRATNELLFNAEAPALGFSTYFVETINKSSPAQSDRIVVDQDEKISVSGKSFTIFFDGKTGLTDSIQLKDGNQTKISLKQTFAYYKSKTGDNTTPDKQASGAYIFRPDGQTPVAIGQPKSVVVRGKAVTEVRQTWNNWISQTIRVYHQTDYVEFDWVVGPIPIDDGIGKEVITRFDTDLANKATFFTDSNGRQMVKRIRDHRQTFKLNVTEPIAGNYYPVNSRIALIDDNRRIQMTVLSDRSQGGSSISNGSVELMIHRRCLVDDNFGVGEALNESGIDGRGLVVRGRHLLLVSSSDRAAVLHRDLAQRLFLQPVLVLAECDSRSRYSNNFTTSFTGLTNQLPANVHLLTLEQWSGGKLLIRLEHCYQSGEDAVLSQPVTVNLARLFKPFTIIKVEETALGGNQKLGHRKRLQFQTLDLLPETPLATIGQLADDFAITLGPMQIRSFLVEIK